MTVEKGTINLEELKIVKVLDKSFGYSRKINEDDTENIVMLPFPFKEEIEEFNTGLKYFSYETIMLLHSKSIVGIKHRTAMLNNVYNTFEKIYLEHSSELNMWLTLQTLYLDMVTKLGTILEDFAGMCYACEGYTLHRSDIAKLFLTYSNPRGFYSSFSGKGGKRKIKQIFNLPTSRGELHNIFKNLNEAEVELLEKAIRASTELIYDNIVNISSAIVGNQSDDFTYYDMYNKIKHGFSPIYPFIFPMPIPIQKEEVGVPIEKVISEYFFESVTIMHNKLSGQRTKDEKSMGEQEEVVIPTFVNQGVNLETAQQIIAVAFDIETIYLYLVNRYLAIAEENKQLNLLMSDDYLTPEEQARVKLVIEDETRYI